MRLGPSRRDFVRLGAGLGLALVNNPLSAADSARGCCIVPTNAQGAYRELFNDRPKAGEDDPWKHRLSAQSGISETFEQQLGDVLKDISLEFGVTPGFGFYDDDESPNAIAIDKAVIRTTNGTVAFGRRLLREQLEIDGEGISIPRSGWIAS